MSIQRFTKLFVAVGAFSTAASSAMAFDLPLGTDSERAAAFAQRSHPFVLESADVDFTSIVALNNCSGSLARFVTSLPTDKAMVLTNGHCLESGFLEPNDAVVNQASTRRFSLLESDASDSITTLRAAKVMYATMTGTDVTLYQLTKTYAEIEQEFGVQALTISNLHPEAGAPIRIVSGYWERIYSCNIDNFVYQLLEGDWTFNDSIRYTRPGCDVIGGTSGSPIIHADTREIIGINNTTNEDGRRCAQNNPCEVDEAGTVTVNEGTSYGQQIYQIYTCVDAANEIDLNIEGCVLTRPLAD